MRQISDVHMLHVDYIFSAANHKNAIFCKISSFDEIGHGIGLNSIIYTNLPHFTLFAGTKQGKSTLLCTFLSEAKHVGSMGWAFEIFVGYLNHGPVRNHYSLLHNSYPKLMCMVHVCTRGDIFCAYPNMHM